MHLKYKVSVQKNLRLQVFFCCSDSLNLSYFVGCEKAIRYGREASLEAPEFAPVCSQLIPGTGNYAFVI